MCDYGRLVTLVFWSGKEEWGILMTACSIEEGMLCTI
jgi:hypothetical protein